MLESPASWEDLPTFTRLIYFFSLWRVIPESVNLSEDLPDFIRLLLIIFTVRSDARIFYPFGRPAQFLQAAHDHFSL